MISWTDCRAQLAGAGLALPTEAQWEYAARAGTRTRWWTGNSTKGLNSAGNLADRSARNLRHENLSQFENWNDGYPAHAAVGRLKANLFGLHDVIGNVFEWCRDPHLDRAYTLRPQFPDGKRMYPKESRLIANRVVRGGCWSFPSRPATSSFRFQAMRSSASHSIGCRPVRGIH